MQHLAIPLHSVRSYSINIKGAHTGTYKKDTHLYGNPGAEHKSLYCSK